MMLLDRLKDRLRRELFLTTRLGIFVNPSYLIRRGLYLSIAGRANDVQGKVLDFGCGAKPYESLFPHASQYIGVDIKTSGHDHKNSKVDIFYDGATLPFEDGGFDGVVSFEVLEHVFNPVEVLAEIHRVLRPGGVLLLSVPFAWPEHEQPYDYARYTSFGLHHLLEHNGFAVRSLEKTGSSVRAISQLFIAQIYDSACRTDVGMIKLVARCAVIPITFFAIILDYILPVRTDIYSGIVVVAIRSS